MTEQHWKKRIKDANENPKLKAILNLLEPIYGEGELERIDLAEGIIMALNNVNVEEAESIIDQTTFEIIELERDELREIALEFQLERDRLFCLIKKIEAENVDGGFFGDYVSNIIDEFYSSQEGNHSFQERLNKNDLLLIEKNSLP